MKSTHLLALLTAVGFATASHAQNAGPDTDRPPGPPPAPRSDDGPRERSDRGPGPDHRRDANPRSGGSDDRQDHIREAMKHLRAAGLGHMAERIEQVIKDNPQAQGNRQNHRGPYANRRKHGHRQEGAGQSFQHPRLPWGGSLGGNAGNPPPFARRQPNERRGPSADRGPRPAPSAPGNNDIQAQLNKLQREVAELSRSIKDKSDRNDNFRGPSPERRHDHPGQPDGRRDESRRGEHGDAGPRESGPRDSGPREERQ